jgi:cytochrome c2
MRSPARVLAAIAIALAIAFPGTSAASSHDLKGRRVFEAKQCARCHMSGGRDGSVAPPLEALRRPQGAWELTGRFWNHAPAMFTALGAQGLAWPTFTVEEMNDLIIFLAARWDADAEPDPDRGAMLLVKKGCLKCHALNGEGARAAPDFATLTAAFASPAVWGVKIWAHAPRMASASLEHGFLFPRFAGQEMGQLVEYLKHLAPRK